MDVLNLYESISGPFRGWGWGSCQFMNVFNYVCVFCVFACVSFRRRRARLFLFLSIVIVISPSRAETQIRGHMASSPPPPPLPNPVRAFILLPRKSQLFLPSSTRVQLTDGKWEGETINPLFYLWGGKYRTLVRLGFCLLCGGAFRVTLKARHRSVSVLTISPTRMFMRSHSCGESVAHRRVRGEMESSQSRKCYFY